MSVISDSLKVTNGGIQYYGKGCVSTVAAGNVVSGVGTGFTESLMIGDLITINGETRTVLSIASDTSLTTVSNWTNTNTSQPYEISNQLIDSFVVKPNGSIRFFDTTENVSTKNTYLAFRSNLAIDANCKTVLFDVSPSLNINTSLTYPINAGYVSAILDASSSYGSSHIVSGMNSSVIASDGAIGTFATVYGGTSFISNQSAYVTMNKAIGFKIDVMQSNSAPFTDVAVCNIGAVPSSPSPSGKRVNLLIGTNTIPTGSFSIYCSSTDPAYLAGSVGVKEVSPDYALDVNGTFGFTPGSSVTPVDNGDVTFEFTNNTTITIKAKGTDGTVRSGTVTLT